jgi:glutathione S-transferase
MADVTLYGSDTWTSPYVFSVWVALQEKGVPFEMKVISLKNKEQHRPDYRDRSLTAKVPTLVHGDFWLSESMAIIEYLDELYPAPKFWPVFPAGAQERARARQIMMWIRTDLLALREERPTTSIFYERASTPLSAGGVAAAEKLVRIAGQVVPEGASTIFSEFTVADADLAFMLHRLLLNGHAAPPRIRAYAEGIWKRPSVRSFVEHERPPFSAYG